MSIKRSIKRHLLSDFSGSVKASLSDVLFDLNNKGIVSSAGAFTRWLNTHNRNQSCYFNGSSYISTPDSGALALTGDVQTWTLYGVAAADWSLTGFVGAVGHYTSASRGWFIWVDESSNKLRLIGSLDGTNSGINAQSTAVAPFTGSNSYDVQIVRNSLTGAITFYIAPAGGVFVQLGLPVSALSGDLFHSTSSLVIGAVEAGVNAFTGYIQKFTLHDDTRLAASWNARDQTNYASTTLTSGGVVWTSTGAIYRDKYDLDVVIGTAANLREHDSGAMLLNGASGSFASTPDSPANSVTGSAIFYAYITPPDNTPTGQHAILGKLGAMGARSYLMVLDNSSPIAGALQINLSANGSSVVDIPSTAAVPYADGVGYWAFWAFNAGVSLTPYTSTASHNASVASAFAAATQLGTPITVGVPAAIFDSSIPLEVGSYNAGTTAPLNGQIYRAGIIEGLDATATPSVDCDPRQAGRSATGVDGDSWFGAEMLKPSARTINTTDWSQIGTGTVVDNGNDTLTISDLDTAASRYQLQEQLVVGTADSHTTTITLSQGTAAVTKIFCYYDNGGALRLSNIKIDWSDPLNPLGNLVDSVVVTENGDGSYTYKMITSNNSTGNLRVTVAFIPAGDVAGVTGSVIVHGLVSLQSEWTLAGGAVIQNSGQKEAKAYGVVGIETTVAPALITTPMTMFLVGKADAINSTFQTFVTARSLINSSNVFYIRGNDNRFHFDAGAIRAGFAADTIPHLHTAKSNGDATSSYEVSSLGVLTGNYGAESFECGTMFAHIDGSLALTGSIGRYMLKPDKMNDLQTKQAEQQLKWKHKL